MWYVKTSENLMSEGFSNIGDTFYVFCTITVRGGCEDNLSRRPKLRSVVLYSCTLTKDYQKHWRGNLWSNFPDTNFLRYKKTNVCNQRTEQHHDKAHFKSLSVSLTFFQLRFYMIAGLRGIKSHNILFRHGLLDLKTVEMALLQIWWHMQDNMKKIKTFQQWLGIGSDHMKTSRNQVLLLSPLGETSSSVLYANNKINMQNNKINAASIPWSKTNCHLSLWPINRSFVPVFSIYSITDWSDHLWWYLIIRQNVCISIESVSMNCSSSFPSSWTIFHFLVKLSFFFDFSKQFKNSRSRLSFSQESFYSLLVCFYNQTTKTYFIAAKGLIKLD